MYRFIGEKKDNFLFLKDEELKHAKVRRIKIGEKIEVNLLNGDIFIGEVEEITKKYLKAKIVEKLNVEENKFYLELFLAMPNRLSKVDDLIEPISELGVNKLIPTITEFSSVKKKDVLKKMDKWKKIALNSIKQCKRLYPLEIDNVVEIENISPKSELAFVFYEKEENRNLKEFLDYKTESVSIFIGNEGGISEKDLSILQEKGFISLSLSKNILRMETAVLTAICQAKFVFS